MTSSTDINYLKNTGVIPLWVNDNATARKCIYLDYSYEDKRWKKNEYQFKKLYNLLDLNYSFYYHFSESESIVLISTILEYSPILRYCDLLYRILQMCLQYKFHQNKAHYKKRQLFHFYCFPLNLKNFFKKNF